MTRPLVTCLLRLFFSLCPLCVLCVFVVNSSAEDWAYWRGPAQNGVSPDKNLPDAFSIDSDAPDSNLIWKAPYGGRTAPVVLNGRVYIINAVGGGGDSPEKRLTQQERVMCFDADTGKVLWHYDFNVFLTDIVADRLGWTAMVGDPETGNVYAHGTQGFLFCFDKDGKVLWQHSLTEEYGRISGYGGRLASPVVDGDLLIISMLNASWGDQARGGTRFVAFDKKTGAVVWWSSTGIQPKDSYSSIPVVADINGERLVIGGGGDGGIHAFQARTGKKVWSSFFAEGAVNLSPIVDGSRVYIGHGESNPDSNIQGRVVCLDAGEVKEGAPKLIWKVDGIKAKFATPVLHEGRLYVPDLNARLHCLDVNNKGKTLWRFTYGRNSFGSPVWADGKIYIGAVNSTFDILKDAGSKCERLYEQYFPGVPEVEINGSPAVANGRIYFLTSTDFYCIGKKNHQSAAAPPPAEPKEPVAGADAKPSQLLVYPADVTLEPGQRAEFRARLFDAQGRFLREVKPEWSLAAAPPPAGGPPALPMQTPAGAPGAPAPSAGPPVLKGQIGNDGQLTVDKTPPGQFGLVVAKAEGLTGNARIRVAPTLPYRADFSKIPVDRTPGGWVNTQGKFAVKQLDGKNVLMKTGIVPSPLVARACAYITVPTATNYTVEADVMGVKKGEDLPDMGLLANRYQLFLEGNTQRLRLVSWEKLPRVDKSIAWGWKPDTWYTMKLTVQVEGDKALVRGKIWQRGEGEPQDWMLQFADPYPNREGSPGLYGNAVAVGGPTDPGTPIYYDNVSVTPNKK
jgi:outer membrane protein assembly factor BamB